MTYQDPIAAIELAHRRTEGKVGPLLANELRPQTFEQAFSLQQAVGQIFAGVPAGEVAGWKCGLPNGEKTVIGALYASTVQYQTTEATSSCRVYPNADGVALVEPELAFELKHDLPPRTAPYSDAEIDAAVATTRLALELIQSRYASSEKTTFFDALADGLVNQGLWLGPELPPETELDLTHFLLKIQYPDGRVETKAAKHPNGHPRAGLYWLVNFLSMQGIGMRRGQQIITGSYAGVLKLPMDQVITLNYGDLGTFKIKFGRK
jgi:2-keto-4-pentenoate hydratase